MLFSNLDLLSPRRLHLPQLLLVLLHKLSKVASVRFKLQLNKLFKQSKQSREVELGNLVGRIFSKNILHQRCMKHRWNFHPLSSIFIHYHPRGLPCSVSDHHRMVLNDQTYKWDGMDGLNPWTLIWWEHCSAVPVLISPVNQKEITNLFRIKAFLVIEEGKPKVEGDAERNNQPTVGRGRACAHHTSLDFSACAHHTSLFQPWPITLEFFSLCPSQQFWSSDFHCWQILSDCGLFQRSKSLDIACHIFQRYKKKAEICHSLSGGRCLAECTVSRWTGGARAGLGQPGQAELPAGDQVTRGKTGWLGFLPSRASLYNLSIGTNCRIAWPTCKHW